MGIRLWMGGAFDHPHERAALSALLSHAVPRWSEEPAPYALFVDFWVGQAKLDLVAVTEHSLVIVDLKEVGAPGGYMTGSLNGSWWHHAPDGSEHEVNAERKNPYRQVEGFRQAMIDWLRQRGPGIFGQQKWVTLDPLMLDAWIVASPSLDEAGTRRELSFISDRDWRWFRVLGLDRLCDALFETMHPAGLTFDEQEIEAMARAHGLTERRSFAGFTWPGEAALPASPLFCDPPVARASVDRHEVVAEALSALYGAQPVSVLNVVGPEGVGKSHVARVVAEELAGRGRPAYWVDCGPARRCPVTLEELLLALANQMPSGSRRQAVVDRGLPLPQRIDTALLWADEARLALFFDDYHELQGGHGVDLFIRGLDRRCRQAQAVVVSAGRPDYLSDPLRPLDAAYTIELAGLAPEHVTGFLAARSQANRLHLQLDGVDGPAIWEKTGGLPTLLNILAVLSANTAPDTIAADVSAHPDAKQWFDRLLHPLSEDARRLAASAAVVRRGLDRDFLLALTDAGKGQALINELVELHVLTVLPDGRFLLAGGLRQYLLAKTPVETRRRAHERALKHLLSRAEGRAEGWPQYLEEAILHAVEAEKPRAVLQHAGLVADELSRLGEYSRGLAVCRSAAEAAEMLKDPAKTAFWRVEQAALLRHLGRADEAERLCRDALKAGRVAEPALAARTYHVLGGLAMDRRDYDAARDFCEKALALDQRLEDKAHEAASLARLAALEAEAGRTDAARELYTRSFAVAEAEGDQPAALARRHFDYSLVEKYARNLPAALAHLDQALVYAERAGGAGKREVILSQMAEVHGRMGRFEEALRLADQSVRLQRAVANPHGLQITLGIRMDILLAAGELSMAAQALDDIESLVRDSVDPATVAFMQKRRGMLLILQRRQDEGLELVQKALEAFRLMGKQHWYMDCEETLEEALRRTAAQPPLPLGE